MIVRGQRSRKVVAGATVSIAALCAALLPAFGQEDGDGGPLFTLGVSTTLSTSDNADLDVTSAGDTTQLETTLNFGFESVTQTQALRFSYSDMLREGSGPDAENDLRGPNLALSYERQTGNARFDVSARRTTRDVDGDLIDEDLGDPDALIVDSGTVTTTNLGFAFETGLQGPLGIEGALSEGRRTYADVTDPDLEDRRTLNAAAALVFRPDQATDIRLTFDVTDFEEEDAVGTERLTRSLGINARRQLDPTTTVTVGFGWTEITEEQTIIPLTLEDESGITALFNFERDLPTGGVSAELMHNITSAGGRTDLMATRRFELPTGALEITFGAAAPDASGVFPTGRIAYSRLFEDQRFEVAVSSTVSANIDGEVQRDTTADLNYLMQFNDRDSVGFTLDLSQKSDIDGSAVVDRTRASATASYRRALTSDWQLSAGLTHRLSREDGSGTARSNTAFLTIDRDFSWRP